MWPLTWSRLSDQLILGRVAAHHQLLPVVLEQGGVDDRVELDEAHVERRMSDDAYLALVALGNLRYEEHKLVVGHVARHKSEHDLGH